LRNSVAYVKKTTFSDSVSLLLPSFRSYRILNRVLFFRCRSRRPGAPPTRMRGKLARIPLGHPGRSPIWRERQRRVYGTAVYGHGLRKRLRKRIRMK